MFGFIAENRGTIIVAVALCAIVAAIIVSLVRKKRSGGCAGCEYAKNCSCSCAARDIDSPTNVKSANQ